CSGTSVSTLLHARRPDGFRRWLQATGQLPQGRFETKASSSDVETGCVKKYDRTTSYIKLMNCLIVEFL
ncbi:hypothetical protein ABTB81_19380, partial [Acinetobacter baumannii]